jgi:hypothetical protein
MKRNNRLNQRLASFLPKRVLFIALTLIGIFFMVEASLTAKPKSSDVGAYLQCIDWCDAHNKTSKSRIQCYHGCDNYYSGVNNVSSAPPPVSPTPGTGTGQVSPPPKSNPGSAPRKGPGRIAPPNKVQSSPSPTSSPTLLEKRSHKNGQQ